MRKRKGRGRFAEACGESACVGRCRSSWQWPGHTLGLWQHDLVVEVRASALFEGREGWVKDALACEVVRGMTVGQYVSRRRKFPLILPNVVMTAGKETTLRSL
jgi:hypothetical protein